MRARTLLLIPAAALALAGPAAAAPTITPISPGADTYSNAATSIALSVSAPGATCVRATLRRNAWTPLMSGDMSASGDTWTMDLPVNNVTDAAYEIAYAARDDGGACADATASTVIRLTLDRQAPTSISITNEMEACPGTGALNCILAGVNPFDLRWTSPSDLGPAGVATVEVQLDGRTIATASTWSGTAKISAADQPSGQTLRIVATDRAGNVRVSEQSPTLIVDTAAPTGRWLKPAQGTWLRGTVAMQTTASDPVAGWASTWLCTSMDKCARSGDLATITRNADTTVYVNTKEIRDARYDFVAVIRDRVGNQTSLKRTAWVDNTAPKFSGRPRTLIIRGRGSRKIDVRVLDNMSPRLRSRTIIMRGGRRVATGAWTTFANKAKPRVVVPATLRSGSYRLTVQIEDLAGNMATQGYPLRVRR